MENCVFCKIIRRELLAHFVYEDEAILAILDHRPIRQGHCMVIPKQHFEQFTDIPDDLVSHIVTVGHRLGRRILDVMEPRPMRIGFVVHGYIPHVHYHVIPQHDEDDITSARYARVCNGQVKFDAAMVPIANAGRQSEIAAAIRQVSQSAFPA